jgi:2-oxo-4-hydroxy-4-carboxy-5-ureidoimidazoline decarboxylase
MPSVDEFNQLPDEAAREALGPCCSSGRWVKAVVAGRPYPDVGALLDASDASVAGLGEPDLAEALAGHPRIGDRRVMSSGEVGTGGEPAGQEGPAGWSSQEQAGVARADDALRRALAEGNEEYERRFGHIYLACATGKDAAELLAFLRGRLGNDRAAEWRVVAAELAKINQIRLRKLVGATP